MHDTSVDRTTDGTGEVIDLTLAEIQSLTLDTFDLTGDFSCERVPTLEQILEAAKGKVHVLVDANKTDRVDLLVAAIQATDTLDWAIFDGRDDIALLLLDRGADFGADRNSSTAVHWAAEGHAAHHLGLIADGDLLHGEGDHQQQRREEEDAVEHLVAHGRIKPRQHTLVRDGLERAGGEWHSPLDSRLPSLPPAVDDRRPGRASVLCSEFERGVELVRARIDQHRHRAPRLERSGFAGTSDTVAGLGQRAVRRPLLAISVGGCIRRHMDPTFRGCGCHDAEQVHRCHRDGHRSAHAAAEPMLCEPIECRVHRRFQSQATGAWIVSYRYVESRPDSCRAGPRPLEIQRPPDSATIRR
jgi:hypothetical protein